MKIHRFWVGTGARKIERIKVKNLLVVTISWVKIVRCKIYQKNFLKILFDRFGFIFGTQKLHFFQNAMGENCTVLLKMIWKCAIFKKIFLEVFVFRKFFRDLRNTQNKLACNGTQKVLTNFVSALLYLADLLIIIV